MFLLEYKLKGKPEQFKAIDEGIRTVKFVRNKCIRLWMDLRGVGKKDIYRHTTDLRKEFSFVKQLNSTACQQAGERAWSAIAKFYDNCKKDIKGKKADATRAADRRKGTRTKRVILSFLSEHEVSS